MRLFTCVKLCRCLYILAENLQTHKINHRAMEDFFDVDMATRFYRDEFGALKPIGGGRLGRMRKGKGEGAQTIPGGAASSSTFAFNPLR